MEATLMTEHTDEIARLKLKLLALRIKWKNKPSEMVHDYIKWEIEFKELLGAIEE